MAKINRLATKNFNQTATLSFIILISCSMLLYQLQAVEAGGKGEDVIMTNGKLILRGGKGKGECLLIIHAIMEHIWKVSMLNCSTS